MGAGAVLATGVVGWVPAAKAGMRALQVSTTMYIILRR